MKVSVYLLILIIFLSAIYLARNRLFPSSDDRTVQPKFSTRVSQNKQAQEQASDKSAFIQLESGSKNTHSKDEYIVTCHYEDNDIMTEDSELIANTFYDVQTYKEILKGSEDFESLLVYMQLLDFSIEEENIKFDILSKLIRQDANHGMLNWLLLSYCFNAKERFAACSKSNIDHAIKNQEYNAAAGLLMISKDDENAAIPILKKIIAAPNFNEYYSENLALYNRVLIKNGSEDLFLNSIPSIGFATGAILPSFSSVIVFCREKSKERADISQLCLEVGQRMSRSSNTIIYGVIGDTIQEMIYTNNNNLEEIERLGLTGIRSQYLENSLQLKANNLLSYDKNLAEQWFINNIAVGEKNASNLLLDEAIRLSADKNYNPCKVME